MTRLELEQALRAPDLLRQMQREERSAEQVRVPAGEVELENDGRLRSADRALAVAPEAQADLARLAKIPAPYFRSIGGYLQAVNFQHRRTVHLSGERLLEVIVRNDKVCRVRKAGLVRLGFAEALDAVLGPLPRGVDSGEVRAAVHARNGVLVFSLNAAALRSEPLPGDVVAYGVHLNIDAQGAVQVGSAMFRLACSNGVLARICAGGRHRIRRAPGETTETIREGVRRFARASWEEWERLSGELAGLTRRTLGSGEMEGVLRRLREAPFHVSARVAQRVVERLQEEAKGEAPTLWDLCNAISSVGSHDRDIPRRYGFRLRLGAGALARRGAPVCRSCRQLLLVESE